MKAETGEAYFSGFFFSGQPVCDPNLLHFFPSSGIQGVKVIYINPVTFQPASLIVEISVQICWSFNQPGGKFVGNQHLVPA